VEACRRCRLHGPQQRAFGQAPPSACLRRRRAPPRHRGAATPSTRWADARISARRLSRRAGAKSARVRLIVFPGVLRPPSDSALLCGVLARLAGDLTGRAVLDLFSGTGILGLTAARLGARVTAVDISRRAVACAWLNARLNRLATRHAARRVRGTRVPTGACSSTASASARRSTCSRVGGCCWCSRASPGRRGDGSPSTASSRRRSLSTWGAWARSPPSDWITARARRCRPLARRAHGRS
jgi:hypothetical protein